MTIIYSKKRFPPPPYDTEVEDMKYYRDLYNGDHDLIFPRARSIQTTERVIRRSRPGLIRRGMSADIKITSEHQYVVVNFASLVAEVPADLINRALGNVSADVESGPELEFVSSVVTASKPNDKIWAAVTQHQVDGLIAYRIRRSVKGKVWFEWMPADRYFPHEDGGGADLAWIEEWDNGNGGKLKFLRVERQEMSDEGLVIQQMVFKMDGETVGDEIDINQYAAAYEIEIPDNETLKDVTELLCGFVINDETLLHPRGRSALRNIDTIQEEINWTITRDSIVFDKHGKPKLAIPRALWDTVANQNQRDYGARFVRGADLEVVSFDERTGAVPQYITWDAKTDQSFKHVERLIRYMLAVSKTSIQAAGLEDAKGDTGIALLYLWIQSVIKAEAIKDKFDAAIKDAIRKCMLLENAISGAALKPVNPVIEWGDMLPKAESEKDGEESKKYVDGVQSLETTVRRLHPDWSEEAIQAEIQKIQDEKAVDTLNPTFTQPPRVTV
ncbi:hypothetical protein [Paenibacillus tianjinensis]|uniref:Phage portal protein, SPP1 Gp6-like n=1 Tax=Paenibacillus tianjinensis TaxID=2810347 RepID=A0ABX7L8D4_9BACL|nr:hypothetical protein [Paenibacillus tianjinensis]QSF42670.1 hypothetical protein JRJ22_15240 [Paenibacillus tianjinensis]